MNKMEDVAKLLGLELGQFFMIDSDAFETSIFHLETNGLHIIDIGTEEFDNADTACLLIALLRGVETITRVVDWKPFEECEAYEDKGDR